MYHPDLERKLAELKAQRKKTLEDFRDLASEATDSADRSCKTMMMFIPPDSGSSLCACADLETTCYCKTKKDKKRTKRLKIKKKR